MSPGYATRLDRSRALCAASLLVIDSARQTVAESAALCAVSRRGLSEYRRQQPKSVTPKPGS
jgi:hypothetical protein